VHALDVFICEVGVIEGRDLRHEPRRVRFGASRDRLEDVLWPNFTAPQKHLAVDVTVASARTSSVAPAVGGPLPLPGRQAVEAPLVKRDIDLRIGYTLATPSTQTIHYYYPFALEEGGRLVPMNVEPVFRSAIWVVVRRLPGMGVVPFRALRSCMHARMTEFVRRSPYVAFRQSHRHHSPYTFHQTIRITYRIPPSHSRTRH
jgi:hypothetical protein